MNFNRKKCGEILDNIFKKFTNKIFTKIFQPFPKKNPQLFNILNLYFLLSLKEKGLLDKKNIYLNNKNNKINNSYGS